MEELQPFVGEWSVEARFPGLDLGDLRGRTTFEWALDRRFLLQRSQAPDPAPDGLMVIGVDPRGGEYAQHYFDSRGVVRVYSMTFDGGVWKLWRETPDFSPLDFHQRFTGTFTAGGDVIEGSWETSPDGRTWEHDFGLIYTRER